MIGGMWGSCVWSIENGTLEIHAGIGEAPREYSDGAYGDRGMPWSGYAAEIRRAVVGCGGTCILPRNASKMFSGCTFLEEVEFRDCDGSKVTSASGMFSYCVMLEKIDLSRLELPRVEDISHMFDNCNDLREVGSFGEMLRKAPVRDAGHLFCRCKNIENLDISGSWSAQVAYAPSMFESCTRLKTIEGLDSFAPRAIRDVSRMFYGCSKLERVSLYSDWSRCEDMGWMFRKCGNLEYLALPTLQPESVCRLDGAFEGCGKLAGIETPTETAWELQDRYGIGVAASERPPFPSPVDFRKVPCDPYERNLEHYVSSPCDGIWLEINLTRTGWESVGPDREWRAADSFADAYRQLYETYGNGFDGVAHPFAIDRKVGIDEIAQMLGSETVRREIGSKRGSGFIETQREMANRMRGRR